MKVRSSVLWGGMAFAVAVPAAALAQAPEPGAATSEPGMPATGQTGATTTEVETVEVEGARCDGPSRVVDFEVGSSKLDQTARGTLDDVAAWAMGEPARRLRLEGYADTSGSPEVNERLSRRRAESVKTYLGRQGVVPERIAAVGFGDEPPANRANMFDRRAVRILGCAPPPAVAVAEPAPVEEVEQPEPEVAPPPVIIAPVPAPAPVVVAPPAPEKPQGPASRVGVGLTLGGGVVGFTDEETRAFADAGGAWEARATVGTRTPLAFEGAYVGSAQPIDALGLDDNAALVGNGVEGTLRVNLLPRAIQPYLFGGLGWTHYNVSNSSTALSSVAPNDDIMTVPFGVGVSFRAAKAFLIDLRGTGRAAYYDSLLDVPYADTGEEANLSSWNVALKLGWEL